jgi:flagellar L-ring protein precursor FlgH
MQLKLNQRIVFSLVVLTMVGLLASNVQAASLWVKAGNVEQSMFADKVARNIGDILTIVVEEKTESTITAESTSNGKAQQKGGVFPILDATLSGFAQTLPGLLSKSTGGFVKEANVSIEPKLALGSESEFKGGGTINNKLTINNKTSVTVVDVLPNGNMVIEGTKVIKAGKETQYAYLRGIVRPVDVSADNTISSNKVSDAQVEIVPEGDLTEAQKQGWLLNAWRKVKPF